MPTLADFLARALPWPAPGQPGVVNLHWRSWKSRGVTGGRPFTDLRELISFVNWAHNAGGSIIRELYFCTSLQKDTGLPRPGSTTPTALRNQENTLCSKAFFADIDKGYETPAHAMAAVVRMCTATRSPTPTAVVVSGNGLHVYWFSTVAFPPDEWSKYARALDTLLNAHGIVHDPVTTDIVRILRPPGTFNNKGHEEGLPAKPVVLKMLAPADIDFVAWGSLNAVKPVEFTSFGLVSPRATISPEELFVDPAEASVPPNKTITDSLKPEDWVGETLDPAPVFQCPMFKHTLETHGAEVAQPLWNQQALACTFIRDGEALFHELSSGHPTYRYADTEAMFARKVRERVTRDFGYPSCSTFEREGSKQCATCPLRGTIKSPLSLRRVPAIGAAAALPTARPAQEDNTERDKEEKTHPIMVVMKLHQQGAANAALFALLNESCAVVRNGSEILVASIIGNEVILMKVDNFHKMFANMRVQKGNHFVEVSRLWFEWPDRRQYLYRGIVFEPGGPLDIKDDRLNLWRGFGIKPRQGEWSLLRSHFLNVLCSGRQDLCDYLIKWMAYAVQHPNEPIGVAVALRGAQGAGKGVVARTFGKIFGKHFAHIANGEQLTGRFNASVATSSVVFLDEAFWAGEKKAEGVLKALITEPRLQLEAKFRDPIMVDNRLRIIVASNSDWVVPAGIGDRRWFVLDVADTFAGFAHEAYWHALYAEIDNGGREAMFYDLLALDLTAFNVRAIPHTAAKAQQQMLSLNGTASWLHHVLQEGSVGCASWNANGLTIDTSHAYTCYEDFSKKQRNWRPDVKAVWSKTFVPCSAPA